MGLYRISGLAQSAGQTKPWSVVLKAPGAGGMASDDPAAPEYWKREARAYQSGYLQDLPGGLAAPRCYGVTDESEHEAWIWLEDIPQPTVPWTMDRHALAGFHLGQFNGAYLTGRPMPPDVDWLLQGGRTPGWIARVEPQIDRLYRFLETPLGRHWFRPGDHDRIERLFANRHVLLQALDRLPRCFCHHDAFRRNLMDRRTADGRVETVAIDWSYTGIGGVGQEIAMTIWVALQWLEVTAQQAAAFEQAVYEGYLAGLRDTGWRGDPRQVRLGYTATASLVNCLAWPIYMNDALKDAQSIALGESIIGHSIGEIIDQWATIQPQLFALGEEALELRVTVGQSEAY
jgi:hypothetical protein